MKTIIADYKNLEGHNLFVKFVRLFSVPLLNVLPESFLRKFMRISSNKVCLIYGIKQFIKQFIKLRKRILSDWPIDIPKNYISFVNEPQTNEEIAKIRYSVNRGKPFGSREWTYKIIKAFGLESTIRNRGRQIKGT